MKIHHKISIKHLYTITFMLIFSGVTMFAQNGNNFSEVVMEVDFSNKLRDWDGFGFNYVETAQTTNYDTYPQEYGGFSLLNKKQKEDIIELIYGESGLKVSLTKMFLDPWHQKEAGGEFNHEKTTKNMREFVRMGLAKTKERGDNLSIITTLYCPPAYITKQKRLRGRDIDENHKGDLVNYLVDWASYLKNEEDFPIHHISLHNEGEDWNRWPSDGTDNVFDGKKGNFEHGHDYNMYWSPKLVCDIIPMVRKKLDSLSLFDIGVTNGEPTNWYRFSTWGYADALASHPESLNNLSVITSHGFYSGGYRNRWFGPHTSEGIDKLRAIKPDLHAWVTSTSWGNMDAKNIKEFHGNIYSSKVNAIIPWAGVQRPPHWVGGDPNPGSALTVNEDGTYKVRQGYYFYKQVSRAGQPGMAVANTYSMDSQLSLIGFSSNKTENSDAFVLVNWSDGDRDVAINVKWSKTDSFEAFRTTEGEKDANGKSLENGEKYKSIGDYNLKNGTLYYTAPKGSVTTFFSTK